MALIGNQTAYLSAGSPAAGKIGIGRSFDAGITWKNAGLKARGYSSRISFPAAKTGWLVVTSENAPAVYETTDGGITWSPKISFQSKKRINETYKEIIYMLIQIENNPYGFWHGMN